MPRRGDFNPFVYEINEINADRAYRKGRESYKRYIRGVANNYIKRPMVRDYVYEKCNHECVFCGSKDNLHIDHIIPVWKLGFEANTIDNLQVLCRSCNCRKEHVMNYG